MAPDKSLPPDPGIIEGPGMVIWARVSFIDHGVAKSICFGIGHASKLPPKWQRWSMADGRRVFANRKLQALETICFSYSIIMVGLH